MIPNLLWRCPLCHAADALVHRRPWFRPEDLRCTRCGTTWDVRRVIGDDFRLRVVAGELADRGTEMPLAEWYDLMKAGFKLPAMAHDASLALAPGEELHLESRAADLRTEQDSPLFGEWSSPEAPAQAARDLRLPFMKPWDTGRLALTSERLIWRGRRGTLTFRLQRLNSVHTEVTWYLGLMYGMRQYKVHFHHESVLKWLTYLGTAARRIEEIHHHRIALSNY
ncbi:MAG: hypothetical protein HY294_02615 [Candidatus Rokubacteria bacterium]|nr:hypothetical protein [Candidatus Rokubacteria bacterium]